MEKWHIHYGLNGVAFRSMGFVEVEAENCIAAIKFAGEKDPKVKVFDLVAVIVVSG